MRRRWNITTCTTGNMFIPVCPAASQEDENGCCYPIGWQRSRDWWDPWRPGRQLCGDWRPDSRDPGRPKVQDPGPGEQTVEHLTHCLILTTPRGASRHRGR